MHKTNVFEEDKNLVMKCQFLQINTYINIYDGE